MVVQFIGRREGHYSVIRQCGSTQHTRFSFSLLALVVLALLVSAHSAYANSHDRPEKPCVVLIHGITKDSRSMEAIAAALREAGFHAVNLDYPSREFPIETLADMTIPLGINACKEAGAAPLHFVTHSMGGLLLRQYYEHRDANEIARAVMLGPPNQGSRLGNFLSCIPVIKDVNGPAGKQMGIDERSLPSRLGPVKFPLGVIAGTRSFNPFFSAIISGDDDGIVGLPSTYVEGTCARVTYPLTHNGLTGSAQAIVQVVTFLKSGKFSGPEVQNYACD
ncbi:triacylglycerol lipase [Microbulbifer sp. HZ11]|uniref:esterase/lipase family protein n=1 Tax=unclassified Microbulbifer TaxID=2619833 RepID=UPI00068E188B|nr:alpha/beta fold hydrolase [Microbulbifer sp. HZ11]